MHTKERSLKVTCAQVGDVVMLVMVPPEDVVMVPILLLLPGDFLMIYRGSRHSHEECEEQFKYYCA